MAIKGETGLHCTCKHVTYTFTSRHGELFKYFLQYDIKILRLTMNYMSPSEFFHLFLNQTPPNSICLFLFVLGLNVAFKHQGHITMVPAYSSGTLTNVLPHRNAMPQTQDMTHYPVTV